MLPFHNSKECQVQHWKQHKPECSLIKESCDGWKESMRKDLPDGTTLDTKEGPCAICLEETITNPVVLQCGHAFCFSCVRHYQQSSTSKEGASCPYCRGEIPEVTQRATERSILVNGQCYRQQIIQKKKRNMQSLPWLKLMLSWKFSISR